MMKTTFKLLWVATTATAMLLLLLDSVPTIGFVSAFHMNHNHNHNQHHNHHMVGRSRCTTTKTTTMRMMMTNDDNSVTSSNSRREAFTTLARRGVGLLVAGSGAAGTAMSSIILPLPVALAATDYTNFQKGPGGILYQIVKEGTGPSPVRAQQVKTDYTLWTGGFGATQVDSSKGFMKGPLPVIVGVGRVIAGWDLMLLQMKVGEVRRMIIPATLGYGERGAGSSIPPNATLYFEVEILDMQAMPEFTDDQRQWLVDNPLKGI